MGKLPGNQGDRADFPALRNRFIMRGADTDGRFALVEHEILPRSLAAPIHTHEREDEYSFVLSGRVGLQIGDDVIDAGPGDFVAKPRGIPHAFWNAGDEPARLLELISPAGFERYFEELAPVLQAEGPPDLERLAAIRDKYALSMDMGSREALTERYELNG
jgi:quercetin dioxygenase-like cupin family protein